MSKPQPLSHTREQITALDKDLLALLAKRRELSLNVARSKEVDMRPIRNTQREKELLSRLVKQGREQGLDAHYVISLYQNIIEDSVLNQQAYLQNRANPDTEKQQYNVAYLGARGSYSYLAANRYCNRRQVNMQDLGCKSFDDIVKAVESGHADYGFLPIENTSSGSINEVYDILQHTSLAIVGETTIEIDHCLLAKNGSKIEQIKTVYAHPQPISQCSRYLTLHPDYKLEYCSSSAEAMEKVVENDDPTVAAIGSAEGGALYQLEPIAQDLANQKINQSRFIIVARKAIVVPEQLPAKSTLIMATGQKPGTLVKALLVLKAHNLNMSKLESRPIPGTPWEEMFYLDLDANLTSDAMQSALKELERITRFIKVLGCYPCETVNPTRLSNRQLMIEPNTSRAEHSAKTLAPSDPISTDKLRYRKASKEDTTEVTIGQLQIGDGHFGAIALISLPQDSDLYSHKAKSLKEAGFQAVILEGLSRQLDMSPNVIKLKKSLHQFNLECIISVEHESELKFATEHASILLIKGKQMYNEALLKQVGSLHIPVILERNTMASIEKLLIAAETILTQGNQQLILCESGVRTFNNSIMPSLDLAALVGIKAISHLPILINPSYASSKKTLSPHAKAGKQLNADGLILSFSSEKSEFDAELAHHSELLRSLYH